MDLVRREASKLAFKDYTGYVEWLQALWATDDMYLRAVKVILRYPMGTTTEGIQALVGALGRRARRELDATLRRLERSGFARMKRTGPEERTVMWLHAGHPNPSLN